MTLVILRSTLPVSAVLADDTASPPRCFWNWLPGKTVEMPDGIHGLSDSLTIKKARGGAERPITIRGHVVLKRCNGEDESLSIKSSDNIFRRNTLIHFQTSF